MFGGTLREYKGVAPVVSMEPTTFRTYSLNQLGAPSAAIRVVQSSPNYQRVVLLQPQSGLGAIVSESAEELDFQGPPLSFIRGEAYRLAPFIPNILVLGPHQSLVAVTTSAVIPRISVSVSAEIPPAPKIFPTIKDPAFFRTFRVPFIGTPTIRIVPATDLPQRVVINHSGGTFFSSAPNELSTPGMINPGEAFESSGSLTLTFLLAPGQALYAAQNLGPGQDVRLSVSASKLDLPSLRGPTGIPGPDGEE